MAILLTSSLYAGIYLVRPFLRGMKLASSRNVEKEILFATHIPNEHNFGRRMSPLYHTVQGCADFEATLSGHTQRNSHRKYSFVCLLAYIFFLCL